MFPSAAMDLYQNSHRFETEHSRYYGSENDVKDPYDNCQYYETFQSYDRESYFMRQEEEIHTPENYDQLKMKDARRRQGFWATK